MISDIIITIQGPEHSGKKHVIAAMKKAMEDYGVNISNIGGDEHLKGKQNLSETELKNKLNGLNIFILDQNTAPHNK